MNLHIPTLLASGGLLQRIPERSLAILAAHLLKRALHQHVPLGGLALTAVHFTRFAILAIRLATGLTIFTGGHYYIMGHEIMLRGGAGKL